MRMCNVFTSHAHHYPYRRYAHTYHHGECTYQALNQHTLPAMYELLRWSAPSEGTLALAAAAL